MEIKYQGGERAVWVVGGAPRTHHHDDEGADVDVVVEVDEQ